jgi:hypothetical protein
MAIDKPALNGDTIYRGAAHIIISKPADQANWVYIFAKGEVVVRFKRSERDNMVEGFGNVSNPSTDENIEVVFTPADQVINATVLSYLYGSCLSAMPGASWYGSSSTPVYVHTMDGQLLTIANAQPTAVPPVVFGAGKSRFGGSVTLTGILARGAARTDTGALFTDWAAVSFLAEPDESTFVSYPCSSAWASVAGTVLESMDGWTFAPQLQLAPVTVANLGTIDMTVGNGLGLEVSGVPANIGLDELWSTDILGASREIGTSRAGGNFTITEDNPGLTALAYNCRLIDPASAFSVENPVAGQCVWRARRGIVSEAWGPLGTLTATAAE